MLGTWTNYLTWSMLALILVAIVAMLLIIFAIITEPVLRYLSLATKKILEMTGRGVDLIRDRIKSKNDIMKVSGQDPL